MDFDVSALLGETERELGVSARFRRILFGKCFQFPFDGRKQDQLEASAQQSLEFSVNIDFEFQRYEESV